MICITDLKRQSEMWQTLLLLQGNPLTLKKNSKLMNVSK